MIKLNRLKNSYNLNLYESLFKDNKVFIFYSFLNLTKKEFKQINDTFKNTSINLKVLQTKTLQKNNDSPEFSKIFSQLEGPCLVLYSKDLHVFDDNNFNLLKLNSKLSPLGAIFNKNVIFFSNLEKISVKKLVDFNGEVVQNLLFSIFKLLNILKIKADIA